MAGLLVLLILSVCLSSPVMVKGAIILLGTHRMNCQEVFASGDFNSGEKLLHSSSGTTFPAWCWYSSVTNEGLLYLSRDAVRNTSIDFRKLNIDTNRVAVTFFTDLNNAGPTYRGDLRRIDGEDVTVLQSKATGFALPQSAANHTTYFYIGILRYAEANNTSTQGFHLNGANCTFVNCDSNPNSYFSFFTEQIQRQAHHYNLSDCLNDNLLIDPENNGMPSHYKLFYEVHFGGCGGYWTPNDLKGYEAGNVGLWFSHEPPKFTNISPNVGPLSGGTRLTLTGSNLNNPSLIIKLAGLECPSRFRNTTVIFCLTPQGTSQVLNMPLSITITWYGVLQNPPLTLTFTYMSDPTITKLEPTDTILSGGTRITVTGNGLAVVGEAILRVTFLYEQVPRCIFSSVCQIASLTTMYCPAPEIDIFGPDGNIDLSACTPPSPRTRRHVKPLRYRRQALEDLSAANIFNNDKSDFIMGLVMDGVRMYQNLSESLPEYAQLTVHSDPVVYKWSKPEVVTRTKRALQVKGERLLVGIQSTDYRMLIGQSECDTLDVYDNLLTCMAPKDTPAPHHTDTAPHLNVRVHIGMFKDPFLVGTLQYKTSFFDDPIAKWGIIGTAVVIGITLTLVTIICFFKRSKRF